MVSPRRSSLVASARFPWHWGCIMRALIGPRVAALCLAAVLACGPAAADEIDKLIKQLEAGQPAQARVKAEQALVTAGMPAVPRLIAALGSRDRQVTYHAEVALSKIGTPAIGPL